MNDTATLNQPTPATKSATPKLGEFGAGRYSPLMASVFTDSQAVFKLSETQADKLARMAGAEYGAIMAHVPVVSTVSRKMNKDNQVTLKDASAKVNKVTMTNTLFAIRALAYASEAGQFGFKYGQQWEVGEKFGEWLAKL